MTQEDMTAGTLHVPLQFPVAGLQQWLSEEINSVEEAEGLGLLAGAGGNEAFQAQGVDSALNVGGGELLLLLLAPID